MAQSNEEPTIASKIADPYAAIGTPKVEENTYIVDGAPARPTWADVAVAARASGVAMGALDAMGTAVGNLFQTDDRAATTEAPAPDPNRPRPEKLVVEAWVTLVTEEVQPVAEQIRQQVALLHGKVTEDQVGGAAAHSWEGKLKVRLPPESVTSFLDWLANRGDLASRRISSTDVSKQFFDHEIALRNLELTLARLQKILEHDAVKVEEVLRIEQEMTRVRTQIDQIKGTLRWLQDSVTFSTIEIRLTGTRPIPRLADAKFQVGGRMGALVLTDPAGRQKTRYGGGAVLQFSRNSSFDIDGFSSVGEEGPTVLATFGGAAYTDFLGGGTHVAGNPYLGLRMGYGRLDHNNLFLISAEVGVELVKLKYLVCEVFLRPTGLLGDNSDFVLHAGAGLTVPF